MFLGVVRKEGPFYVTFVHNVFDVIMSFHVLNILITGVSEHSFPDMVN